MTITRRFLLQGLSCQASIGIYDAEIRLHREVKVSLTVEVVAA